MRVLAEQNRAFGYAIAASAALHALLLLNLPAWREAAPTPPERPLVARLVEPAPPAPAARPVAPPPPVVQKPQPPKPRPPKPLARPKPTPVPRAVTPLPSPPPAPPESEERPAEPPAATAPPPPAQSAAVAAPPVASMAPARPTPDPASALAGFREEIRQVAGRYKRYPRVALDNGWTGDVVVLIDIAPGGSVSSIRIKTSSGYEVLDEQALEMFGKAVPQVPVPSELRGRAFTVELRAVYNLTDRPG
jgi:protein TonB